MNITRMLGSSRHGPSAGRAGRGLCLWGAALAALVPLVVDCGGSNSGDDDEGARAGGDPCQTVYRGQCGAVCSDDGGCATGLFCGGGTCTAQCTAESGCTGGQTCSTRGRCVSGGAAGSTGFPEGPPIGTGASGGGGAPGGGGGGNCPDVRVTFQPINPAVMLVLDRSASMSCPITSTAEFVGDCGAQANPNSESSRWQSFKAPLLDVVLEVQADVIFGASFYPQGDGCGIAGAAAAGFKLDNYDEIKSVYDQQTPGGQTPTGPAIDAAVARLNAGDSGLPEGTPKIMILATDGSPFCSNSSIAEQQARAVEAIGGAFGGGIRTFVIAIGELLQNQAGADKRARFQAMANAGAGLPVGGAEAAPLYLASDRDALAAALRGIINGVRPCSFDLDVALTNPAADGPKGVVTIDGTNVPFDDPNGWRLADPDTIEFVGAACESIRGGSRDVQAAFPCDVQTTPSPNTPPPR